jgi:hypothetical protein
MEEAAMTTFGKVPSQKGDGGFDLGVSDDRRAFTLTFSDLKVAAGKQPIGTRLFSLVMPLEGDRRRTEIEFTVQGFAFTTTKGATATLLFSVNAQSVVLDLPANTDQSVVQPLKFVAEAPSDCRLHLLLLAGRDAADSAAEAVLTVSTIDAELLPRPK